MDELTARREKILCIVISEYVETAKPVGSATIVENYDLGVSPATVRNELSYLTEQGYLSQPHTSAGRVPTEKGYRYFVERLMEDAQLPPAEQLMIRHQFYQVGMDLEQWMKLAAAVLARTGRGAALVTTPRAPYSRLRHIELISVSENAGLMVLVLQGGIVRQQVLLLTDPVSQEELSRLSNRLNMALVNQTVSGVETYLERLSTTAFSRLEVEVLQRVAEIMRAADSRPAYEVYHDGLVQTLQEPEFSEITRARQFVEIVEGGWLLDAIMAQMVRQNGVHVIIGGEGRWAEVGDYSMVFSTYGPAEASGILGLLGPMRMSYGRAISTVRYVARLMSDLLQSLYGETKAE
ncbi:MAG: heat-inducible transcription repressor HrcA [Chloroflexi bacterium]|nr:heat-inducible transcription repressor HrcA [Chloroflexota bacterium]